MYFEFVAFLIISEYFPSILKYTITDLLRAHSFLLLINFLKAELFHA